MGREERRTLEKQGLSKEEAKKRDALNSYCSVLEAIQLSQAAAEDAIKQHVEKTQSMDIAQSLTIESIKSLLIQQNVFTEDEFLEKYKEQTEVFKETRQAYIEAMQKDAEGQSQEQSEEEGKSE